MADSHDPRLAALLRAYPLYDFDRSRVATRAYFLGQTMPDSFDNWLKAENLESFLQADSALACHGKGSIDFLLEYGVCQTSCRLNLQAALPIVDETVIAGRSGLRWTTSGRSHGRMLRVQRSGCLAWACS